MSKKYRRSNLISEFTPMALSFGTTLGHLRSICAFMMFVIASPALVHGAPMDFDADGVSDRVIVQILDGGGLRWQVQTENSTQNLGTFGQVGDHLTLGSWLSPATPLIGYLRSSGSDVTWNISSNDQTVTSTFGKTSDTLVSGGDFNGDGVIDGAFASRSRGSLVWSINTGLFSSGTTQQVTHGSARNSAFYMNLHGSHDWLAVLRTPAQGALRIRLRNSLTGEVSNSGRAPRSLRNFSRPVPLAQADGRDVLMFARKGSAKTTVVVVSPRGRRLARTSIAEAADTVIGDFIAEPGEEVAFKSTSGLVVFNPFSKTLTTLESPAGIPMDEVNINTFQSEDDSGLPTPRDNCYDSDPTDGSGQGFIWKPESDTQFGAVVILPSTYKNKVRSVTSTTVAGAEISEFSFKGNANPDPNGVDRPHYIDRSIEGPTYRRQYRSIYIEVELSNGACLVYSIENPAQRYD